MSRSREVRKGEERTKGERGKREGVKRQDDQDSCVIYEWEVGVEGVSP